MFLLRFPFHKQELHFSDGDKTGARVAGRSLLEAALESAAVEGVYIINDQLEPDSDPSHSPSNVCEATSSWIMSTVRSGGDFVGLVSMVDFARFALWRLNLPKAVPICAMIHAIPHENVVPFYIASLLLAQPYDRILVSSNAGKEAVRSLIEQCISLIGGASAFAGRTSEMIDVVPWPVNDGLSFETPRKSARRIFSIPDDVVVFVVLGRITSEYKADLEPLIRAFLQSGSADSILVIAGHEAESGYVTRLQQFVASLALTERVRFILNIPSYSKHLVFALGDVFVAPADNVQETFGIAICEAMFAGLPVIATDWSGHRDLVLDGQTGFLIDTWIDMTDESLLSMAAPISKNIEFEKAMSSKTFFDVAALSRAMETLSENPAMRQAMGQAGRIRATELCSPGVVMPKYKQIWDDQLAEAKACFELPRSPINYVKCFAEFPRAKYSIQALELDLSALSFVPNALFDPLDKKELQEEVGRETIGELFRQSDEQRRILRSLLKKGLLSPRVSASLSKKGD